MEDVLCEEFEKVFTKLPANLHKPLKHIIKRNGFIIYEISSNNLSKDSGSYMGILYEVDVISTSTDNDKKIHLFIKNIVEKEEMKIYSVPAVFKREAFFYNDIANIFKQLQNEADIPENMRLKTAYSFEECNEQSIILDNLVKQGFKVYNRMETVPLDYAKLSIEQLAKFHALSFVIQHKRPDYFNKKIINMKQPFVFEKEWFEYVLNMYNYSITCLEPEIRDKFADAILKKVYDYPKYMNDETGVRTICHGDYKVNNVMAKEINSQLTEVVPIDFQILHYGCPVLDFLYFIFNGTDEEFRKLHLTSLKNLYYTTMEKFLENFGMDIEEIYPKVEFERVYKEKLDFGLMINVFYVPFLFACEDDLPDVTQSLSNLSFNVDKRFTQRFRGVVNDFINWGYI